MCLRLIPYVMCFGTSPHFYPLHITSISFLIYPIRSVITRPLSPLLYILFLLDREKDSFDLLQATKAISDDLVPAMVKNLMQRDFRSQSLCLSEGYGLDLSKELHCRGINMRHLGLARSLLFRPICGTVSVFFHDTFLRTSMDLRREVKNGECVRIRGDGAHVLEFTILETDAARITHDKLPISVRYTGLSIVDATGSVGGVSFDRNNAALRSIFLAEMVARALKAIVRLQLRSYSKNVKGISAHFQRQLLVEYFNVVTGSNPQSNHILAEIVFETIGERFGPLAVRHSERYHLQQELDPCIGFLIKRLQAMMGVQLSVVCLAAFNEQPKGFKFCDFDFLNITPVVRFNLPMFPYSEAMIALLSAERAERNTYIHQVILDGASVFLRLCELKGSLIAENKGFIGRSFVATYNRGCELNKVPGPEKSDPHSRSAGFRPGVLCAVDTKFCPDAMGVTPDAHFSVELHAQCVGGSDTLRHALTAGRFSIIADRDNYWVFQYSVCQHDISIRLQLVTLGQWVYIAATFDGVTVRCYVDSILSASLEVAGPLRVQRNKEAVLRKKYICDLLEEERVESDALRVEIGEKLVSYFNSRDGVIKMRKVAKLIFDDPEFQDRDFGLKAKNKLSDIGILKVKKAEALREAKELHTADIYKRMSREITLRFKQLRAELVCRAEREDREGERRTVRAIRIGAAPSSSSSLADTVDNFYGNIGLLSVYPLSLSADQIKAHHFLAHSGNVKECQRLYALTATKYEDALQFAYDDPLILKGYAKTLCACLRSQRASQFSLKGTSGAEVKILQAISKYYILNLPEGIGEILLDLPKDPAFAAIMSYGFASIKELDPHFFSRSVSLTRKDMVMLPQIFGLDHPRSPADHIAAASGIYREVVREHELRTAYGGVDLTWLQDIAYVNCCYI